MNLDESRYARLRWNTPLSEDHAELLLDRLDPTGSIVDLGCGWGELLLRAVKRSDGTGIGVDTDPAGLARGRVLVGDGCWPSPPSPAALEIFGTDVLPLADLAAACGETGWRVLHLSTADEREWDDFESRHRAGQQEWLLANETDPRAAEVRDSLDHRQHEYLTAYRNVLGLAYLVLAR